MLMLAYDTGADGVDCWYLADACYRDAESPIVLDCGSKYWHVNGKLHREDGPAIEGLNGTTHWFVNGKRHRTDGPATEWDTGERYWFLDGRAVDPLVHFLTIGELALDKS